MVFKKRVEKNNFDNQSICEGKIHATILLVCTFFPEYWSWARGIYFTPVQKIDLLGSTEFVQTPTTTCYVMYSA